ncbi:MAG: alcohol dehydrogenase catalytic domain-containing protein [Candidatus Eremiobacteraeota bacterium]|nr:alcohol dehydrogenase catalytic domain-containing protein [Candidatus Eremiobacteraeota bacterium]
MSIPKTMRAVVCYAPGDYRLETVPVPRPGRREILTKVEAVGICMGDIKTFNGAASLWGDDEQPAWVKAPVIPGHEFIGRVVALGEGAAERSQVKIGDRVIAEQIVPCWMCRFCKRGEYWMCERHDIFGFQGNVNGAMAEYMLYPQEAIVHVVPDEVPIEEAIVVEPLSCSMHAADRGRASNDDVVVVAGAGTLGLGIVGAIRQKNPARIVSLDVQPTRLDLAKRLGADVTINTSETDAVAAVKAMTDGYGCDVFIEATGYAPMVNVGMQMIRKLGRFVEFSVFSKETTLDWSIIGDRKELDVLGAHLGPYCYPRAIRYIADRTIDVRGIVTHEFDLADFKKAFDTAERGVDSLKVVMRP